MEAYLFLIIIDNKKYYSKCIFNKENILLFKIKEEPENIEEYYCSLWMNKVIDEPFTIKYISKLLDINTNHKFDIVIDEPKSYVYIKKKLKMNNISININIDDFEIPSKKFTEKEIYKPIYDKLVSLSNETITEYIDIKTLFEYILFKYKKIVEAKGEPEKYKNGYGYELRNNKVDRDSGRPFQKMDPKYRDDYKYEPFTIKYRKEWLKEEFINEIKDEEELCMVCNIFRCYYYNDHAIDNDFIKNWLEVVKVLRTMIEFINNLSTEDCVKEVYDYYNNLTKKYEKIFGIVVKSTDNKDIIKKFKLKLLTICARMFMVEDNNFISYGDYNTTIEVTDYDIEEYNTNNEKSVIVRITFDNKHKLYYEDCYEHGSYDGYIETYFDYRQEIPKNLHKRFFHYILCYLSDYENAL